MAKVKAPAPAPVPATPDAPKVVDISPLITSLNESITAFRDASSAQNEATVTMAVECRSFREENPDADRPTIRLALQTAISQAFDLKIEHVQNKVSKEEISKANAMRDAAARAKKLEEIASRNSAYVLVSQLLSIAWPKDEKEDKNVQKALESGEKRFVVLKKLASKQNARGAQGERDKKISKDNFAEKLNLFLTQAQADIGCDVETIFDLADRAIDAMKSAPKDS